VFLDPDASPNSADRAEQSHVSPRVTNGRKLQKLRFFLLLILLFTFLNIVGGNKNTCSSVFHPTIPEWSFFLISLSIRKVLITLIPLYLFKIASVAFIGVKNINREHFAV